MRIGCFVPVVSRLPGYERNVSGHIQIPLRAMQLMADRGHDVHLITNEFDPERRVLPWCMPSDVTVHYVIDSRRRCGVLEKKATVRQAKGVYPLAFVRQINQFQRIIQDADLDVLHLFGAERVVKLATILKLFGCRVPIVITSFTPPPARGPLSRLMWRSSRCPMLCATEFVTSGWKRVGLDTHVVPHGIVRDLLSELTTEATSERRRVLYWRSLTPGNGGHVCMKVFDALAPEFPEVSFDLAIRPEARELPGAEQLCARHENVTVYRFPYPPGVSLANLISESICILLPFQRLTMQPQLAIAESLAAGVPVIATDLDSTPELVTDRRNGLLVPVDDVDAAADAVRWMLSHRDEAAEMGRNAQTDMRVRWTWEGYAERVIEVYEQIVLTG